MTAPLYEALLRHRELNRASFHTPGHKSAPGAFPADLLSLDYTELPDTDSLYEASGAILEAEQEAARLFGVERTLISSGGCTLCIQAMLRLAAPDGGTVIAGRVLHRSAVNAMALLGVRPAWVFPSRTAGPGLPGRVTAEEIGRAFQEHPDAKAVYLTSPDYYGVLCDISGIAALCRERGVPLLVDNAHGAHLKFLRRNLHPASLGASMTACSAHKTLPVLTGGAWLNIAEKAYADGAKAAMALFGSTSPSYPVMASLDLARDWLECCGKAAYARLEEQVAELRGLALSRGIAVPKGPCDPTRLSLRTASIGLTGWEAAEHFRRCGAEPEYADGAYLVLIPTPFNSPEDFERLRRAILSLPAKAPFKESSFLPPPPPVCCPPREAILAQSEEIPLKDAAGRIAAESACPCPPGIPVVMPGEKITEESREFLLRYGFFSIKVLK